MRKRVWTDEKLIEAVKNSISIAGVLRNLNMHYGGGNYDTVRKAIKRLGLDASHFLGQASTKGRIFYENRRWTDEEAFSENSAIARYTLKKRIINQKLIDYKCAICGCNPVHNGIELVLILDHINGIRNDNRFENLRFLCPNCNSQQDTFCGGFRKRTRFPKNCIVCGCKITCDSKSGKCVKCVKVDIDHTNQRKVVRPEQEVLKKEIEESNYCVVARKYGLSDNAIRKWLK